jgi:hypothetical protein
VPVCAIGRCCCSGSPPRCGAPGFVALDVSDLAFDPARGVKLLICSSKTDQEQSGAVVAVPYGRAGNPCAVRALRAWLDIAGIHRDTVGAEWLSVGRPDRQAPRPRGRGLPTAGSAHSLWAGYATAAAAAGVEERKIANVTRHQNLPVLRRYIRAATAFDDVGEVL